MLWIKLFGMWLFCDGLYSIHYYFDKNESWLMNHSVRILRMLGALALMVWG